MARYTGPKTRIARRFGEDVFNKSRSSAKKVKRLDTPPGMHGKSRKKKKSEYGIALEELQKLKAVYGMLSKKQVVNAYRKAVQRSTPEKSAAQLLAETLERRLDNIVYRLRFAPSHFAAQQLVSHGHIMVNGKRVDRRSYQIQDGDIISVKPASRQMALVKNAQAGNPDEAPSYLSLEDDKASGKFVGPLPSYDQLPTAIPINFDHIADTLAHRT